MQKDDNFQDNDIGKEKLNLAEFDYEDDKHKETFRKAIHEKLKKIVDSLNPDSTPYSALAHLFSSLYTNIKRLTIQSSQKINLSNPTHIDHTITIFHNKMQSIKSQVTTTKKQTSKHLAAIEYFHKLDEYFFKQYSTYQFGSLVTQLK